MTSTRLNRRTTQIILKSLFTSDFYSLLYPTIHVSSTKVIRHQFLDLQKQKLKKKTKKQKKGIKTKGKIIFLPFRSSIVGFNGVVKFRKATSRGFGLDRLFSQPENLLNQRNVNQNQLPRQPPTWKFDHVQELSPIQILNSHSITIKIPEQVEIKNWEIQRSNNYRLR